MAEDSGGVPPRSPIPRDLFATDSSEPCLCASFMNMPCRKWIPRPFSDRKSTRLNSSHQIISYAVFCLKKKKQKEKTVDKEHILAGRLSKREGGKGPGQLQTSESATVWACRCIMAYTKQHHDRASHRVA